MRPQVVIGMVGSALDQGDAPDRWERWRPTVDLFRHDDFLVQRFELLHLARDARLAETITADIRAVSPETEVRAYPIDVADPWDFEPVYGALHDFARAYAFTPDREDYLVHMTTGTHVVQICLFLLTESRHLPARLVRRRRRAGAAGWVA
jgi:transcriptional regulatory protein RtcR